MTTATTPRDFMDNLGDWMRRERRLLRLTQSQVAAALGVSDSTYSDYERGLTMIDARNHTILKHYFHREHINRGIPSIQKLRRRAAAAAATPFERLCEAEP